MKQLHLSVVFCALFLICLPQHSIAQSLERLMPPPKAAYYHRDSTRMMLSATTLLVLPDTLTPGIDNAATLLENAVQKKLGLQLKRSSIRTYMLSMTPGLQGIIFLPASNSFATAFSTQLFPNQETAPSKKGSYMLDIMPLRSVIRSADEEGFENRWIFSQHNLQVNANVTTLRSIADSMALLKLNGISQHDFKLGILDRVIPQYFKNVDSLKKYCNARSIEIIPGVCAIGWSSNTLLNDPQLAEGLETRTKYVIESDTGRIVADARVSFSNGGFESADASGNIRGFSYVDTAIHQDKVSYHSGTASAHCNAAIKGANARCILDVQCQPYQYYSMSVWFKTKDCSADEFRLMALADRGSGTLVPLTFSAIDLPANSSWHKAEVYFNTMNATRLVLYAGIWGGRSGELWMDDLEVRPAGLTNVLRRAGTPLSATLLHSTQTLSEGVDFLPIHDTWWDSGTDNLGPYHQSPTFRISSSSHIHNGDTVELRYFHPFAAVSDENGNGSVMVCVSEDTLYSILNHQLRGVDALYNPQRYFMSHDEIRSMNHDDACTKRKLTPARLLAENINKCDSLLHVIRPASDVFMWSDMVDSLHNAINNYYLIDGDLRGIWNRIDTSITIVNWNGGKKANSMKFFADHGFSQITSPYYDAGNSKGIRDWRVAQEAVKGIRGMMYTTWAADYKFLRPFAYYAWSAGPFVLHTALDSTALQQSTINIDTRVFSDPFDAADQITKASFVIEKTSKSQQRVAIALTKSQTASWTTSTPLPDAEWFCYSIEAQNSQGLTRRTPVYTVGRKKSDTLSAVQDEEFSSVDIVVFPQPTTSTINCKLPFQASFVSWSLFSTNGRLQLQGSQRIVDIASRSFVINTNALQAGEYILQCNDGLRDYQRVLLIH